MRLALFIAFTFLIQAVRADDLDDLASSTVTAEARGQIYGRLLAAPFSPMAARLAVLIDRHQVQSGFSNNQPWADPNLNEGDRIASTLLKLWRSQIKSAKTPGQNMEILLNLLDDASLGAAKDLPARDVYNCLRIQSLTRADPALPPLDMILRRLERVANDPQQPRELRPRIVGILYEFGDPNRCLDLAIALSEGEKNPEDRMDATFVSLAHNQSAKLTEANRRKYVRHCGQLLAATSDKEAAEGVAWFVARNLGEFVGIPPARPGLGPFVADSTLPEYKEGGKDWMVDTVHHAQQWWKEHQGEYEAQ